MGEVTRLNINAALNLVRGRAGTGLQRIRNKFAPDDLRAYMRAIGNELIPGKFSIDQDNSYVYESVRKWVDGDPDFEAINPLDMTYTKGDLAKGIFIAGPTGTGKTMLLEVLCRYAKGLFLKAKIDGRDTEMAWETYRADEICMDAAMTGDVDKYVDIPVLCVNDIGSEPKETLYMGNRIEVMRMILERRGDNLSRRVTLLTSNYPIDQVPYGDRVKSRLVEMCNYYTLGGRDRRR